MNAVLSKNSGLSAANYNAGSSSSDHTNHPDGPGFSPHSQFNDIGGPAYNRVQEFLHAVRYFAALNRDRMREVERVKAEEKERKARE